MALRLQIEAEGLSGVPYRIDLYDNQWSGSVTTLTADEQFIRFEGGEPDYVGIHPLQPREVRIFIRDNEDLSDLFTRTEEEVPIEVHDLAQTEKVFDGYMVTDFFSDAPFRANPLVEIRAFDGLALLKDYTFNDTGLTGSGRQTYTDILAAIFSSINDLQASLLTNYYPDSGGVLTTNDCPLEFSTIDPNNFWVDRDVQEDWMTQYQVLLHILISQGATLMQRPTEYGLRWVIWQRDDLDTSNDSFQTSGWTLALDGTVTGVSTYQLLHDKTADEFDFNHTRSLLRRRQTVTLTHNHVGYKDLIPDGDWEGVFFRDITGVDLVADSFFIEGDWTQEASVGQEVEVQGRGAEDGLYSITSLAYDAGAGETEIGVDGDITQANTDGWITNSHWSPTNPTAHNDWEGQIQDGFQVFFNQGQPRSGQLFEISHYDDTSITGNTIDWLAEQSLETLKIPKGAYGRLRAHWHMPTYGDGVGITNVPRFQLLTSDGYTLTDHNVVSQGITYEGSGEINVTQVPVPIPSGAVLYVNNNGTLLAKPDTTFRVTERVEQGDSTIIGEARSRIPDGAHIRFVGFVSGSSASVDMGVFTPENDIWEVADFYFSPIATDGTHVEGATTFKVGAKFFEFPPDVSTTDYSYIDDLIYNIEDNGQILDQTIITGTIDKHGETDSIEGRLFSGPKPDSISSVQGITPSGEVFDADSWGTGPSATQGLSLGELVVQRRLRLMRDTLRKWKLRFYLRDEPGFQIDLGSIIEFGTDQFYTVSAKRHEPQAGILEVTLLELKDFNDVGTITLETSASVEDAAGGTTIISSSGSSRTTIAAGSRYSPYLMTQY